MDSFTDQIKRHFTERGYSVQRVSWEDCARSKNSCWGPCITDMTLRLKHSRSGQPVVRVPNFSDVTWDTASDSYHLRVGDNMVSLKEYLDSVKGGLYLDRDAALLTQTQCCTLPLGGADKVEFGLDVYTYSGRCLFVVASSHGTSHFLVDGCSKTLKHVAGDSEHWFTAEKMIDEETKEAVASFTEMNAEQRASNTFTVFQIPLKRPPSTSRGGGGYFGAMAFGAGPLESCPAPKSKSRRGHRSSGHRSSSGRGADGPRHGGGGRDCVGRRGERADRGAMARLGVGSRSGTYTKPDDSKLVRDDRYPIRVTIQNYRIVDGPVDMETADDVIDMLKRVDPHASNKGSLVIDSSARPTEPDKTKPMDWNQENGLTAF